jgi:hypothetical protein
MDARERRIVAGLDLRLGPRELLAAVATLRVVRESLEARGRKRNDDARLAAVPYFFCAFSSSRISASRVSDRLGGSAVAFFAARRLKGTTMRR